MESTLSAVMQCSILALSAVGFTILLTGCTWNQVTWKSPTRLCTGRIAVYPELVKLKQGPKGAQVVSYGAELTLKARC